MSKILITAFEPFGLDGAHIRHSNASIEVLDRIRENLPDNYVFEILPVSDAAEEKLKEILAREKPDGVISMGEDMAQFPSNIAIEPYAIDKKLSLSPIVFSRPEQRLVSKFALSAGAHPKKSSIGAYYCNRIYLTALKWSQENSDKPVSFLHIPILGTRDRHAEQVCKVISKMENTITAAQAETAKSLQTAPAAPHLKHL